MSKGTRSLLLLLVSGAASLAALAQPAGGIGFATVAAALDALKARSDVTVSDRGGWTIIEDRAAKAFWSFTPLGHPAHPAAVKRTIVSRDGNLAIEMGVLCQAAKPACDRLVAEFQQLNEQMGQSTRANPPPAQGADEQGRVPAAKVQLVEQQTRAYFAAKDGRKYQEAYALFSPSQKEAVPFDQWSSQLDEFNLKAGDVRSRTIRKISWYKDPPRNKPGLYAAVDFSSVFANVDVHCGYVAWQEQADGAFLLVREEQNFVDKATQQKLRPGELEKVRAEFRC